MTCKGETGALLFTEYKINLGILRSIHGLYHFCAKSGTASKHILRRKKNASSASYIREPMAHFNLT